MARKIVPTLLRTAIRRLRKELLRHARNGQLAVSLLGSKATGWVVAVLRGESAFIVSQRFAKSTVASLWCQRKTGAVPSWHKGLALAA